MTGWLRNVFGADKANDAQVAATAAAVAGDQEALNYLKQREQLPVAIRDEALQGLSGFYQIPGQMKSQEELIAEAKASPLYAERMGRKQMALDDIARYSSATGQLRSGNSQVAFGRESERINREALLDAFSAAQERDDYSRALNLSGLSGLAGLSDNSGAVAGLMSGMGRTQAQGILGQAQTQTSATNNVFNTLLGVGQLAASFSDIRLKKDIQYIGDKGGYSWYRWEWNDAAKAIGLDGESVGVLAHEVYATNPEAVGVSDDGWLCVDYSKLEIH